MKSRYYIVLTLLLLVILIVAIIGVGLMLASLFFGKIGLFAIFMLATLLGEMELCSILEDKIKAGNK